MARAIPKEIDISEHIRAHDSGTATQKQPLTSDPEMAEEIFDSSSPNEPVPRLHAKTFLALFAVCLIYFAQLVSVIGAGVQAQTIGSHFNDTSKVVWFQGSIGLFAVVLGPIVSQAADYWNRKWFLIIPTLFGAAGSAIIARATSINMVIGGFCVAGIAFSTQPLLHVVTSEVLPRRWRGWGQASNLVFITLGGLLGLFVGAALNRSGSAGSDGFRYYYYMAMSCFFIAAVVCIIVYKPRPLETQTMFTTAEKLSRLDWYGYALLATGLTLFTLGLSYFYNPYPWSNPHVFAIFTIGLAISIILVIYETVFKKDGLFHHGLFSRNRNFAISSVCICCEGVAFTAVNIYFTYHVNTFYEKDEIFVAIRYSFKYTIAAIFACLAGWFCMVTRRTRWLTTVSFALFLIFFICMATSGRGLRSNHAVWGYTVFLGAAFGITLTTLVTVAQLSTPPELISIASGLIISLRALGNTVGLAIYNAVFHEALDKLWENVAQAVVPQGLSPPDVQRFIAALESHNSTDLYAIPNVTESIIQSGTTAFLDTYVWAFRYVWITAGCFVFLSGVAASFLIDEPEQFSMRIDHPIEEEGLYALSRGGEKHPV